MPDDERKSPEDRFRPDAIAARIEKLGTETDAERVEREEEQKLLERKKERRKSALETAASKRLSKIGEGNVKRPSVATGAVAEAVPLLERAARANKWIQEHRGTVGAIAAAALLCLGGALSWVFWQDKRTTEASVLLAQGLADEHGHITATAGDDDAPTTGLYPTFKSDVERRDAALAKYRSIESKYPGTGAAILARLSEASLLLDAGDAKGAIAAYEEVKGSALARADSEVLGRALEGKGFGDELLAQTDGANRDKHLDDALAEFKALEAVDVEGFKELGMYHQARVRLAKDDRAAALDLLKKLHERMDSPGETAKFSYLQFVVEDRLRELDPTALPPKAPPTAMGGRSGKAGGLDMNDPKVQEILHQLQLQQQQKARSGEAPAPVQPDSKP